MYVCLQWSTVLTTSITGAINVQHTTALGVQTDTVIIKDDI